MLLMDLQFAIGLGTAIIFGLLPYVVKDMPRRFSWAGIVAGVIIILLGVLPWITGARQSSPDTPSPSAAVVGLIGFPNLEKEMVSGAVTANLTLFSKSYPSVRFASIYICRTSLNIGTNLGDEFGCYVPTPTLPADANIMLGNSTQNPNGTASTRAETPENITVDGQQRLSTSFELEEGKSVSISVQTKPFQTDWNKISEIQLGVIFVFFQEDGTESAVACRVLTYNYQPLNQDFETGVFESEFSLLPSKNGENGNCRNQAVLG